MAGRFKRSISVLITLNSFFYVHDFMKYRQIVWIHITIFISVTECLNFSVAIRQCRRTNIRCVNDSLLFWWKGDGSGVEAGQMDSPPCCMQMVWSRIRIRIQILRYCFIYYSPIVFTKYLRILAIPSTYNCAYLDIILHFSG